MYFLKKWIDGLMQFFSKFKIIKKYEIFCVLSRFLSTVNINT